MREHLRNTVSKFEFTQGYTFRKHPERLKPFLRAIKARGFNVWDQHAAGYVWGDEQFASLERSLQAADNVGLKVWATLVPPSEKAELRRMPQEQRRRYFYTCVERFHAGLYLWLHPCADYAAVDQFTQLLLCQARRQRIRIIC